MVSIDLDMLKQTVMARGIPGFEDEVRKFILENVSGDNSNIEVDEHGNIIVLYGGEGPLLMFAAHMDELGLLTTNVFDDGKISFRKLGGIDDRVLPARHVEIRGDKGYIPGVIGFPSPHLNFEREQNVIPWHKLRIDIGANSKREAVEMGVKPGQPVFFKKHWTILAGGKAVSTRGLDDRVGVFILLQLARRLRTEPPRDRRVALAFTVREEIGLWGAYALAAKYRPDAVIAVDTMACCRPEITGEMRPGGGPALRLADNLYIATSKVADMIRKSAEHAKVNLQVATGGGSTDASAFQRLGVPAAAIGIPLLNTHTFAEIVYLDDIAGAIKLLLEVVYG
ncbi:MAG: M42 family metallopeptidase [Desulfurococcales archaeon]|nr:M42 family metallopeptidase [Desulfurococcales archaeon]